MFEVVKNIRLNGLMISFLFSVFIHSGVFILAGYLLSRQLNKLVVNTIYVEFLNKEENSFSKSEIINDKKEETKPSEEIKPVQKKAGAYFYNFTETNYDTSSLMQVYKESTLNVSLRYPNGWTYLDQDVKNKLDGVTFWAVDKNYEIPPYVHLDVCDKTIFNSSRFKYKFSSNGSDYYYNDPEELEGHFTQVIYIRTNADEDYSIKLIVKGKEAFRSFQPVFFNMAKSFNFGKSFF
jgi:hypothetical protein